MIFWHRHVYDNNDDGRCSPEVNSVHPPFSAGVHRTSLQLLVSFALRPGLPDSCQHTVHPPFSAGVHRTSLQLLVSFALRPGLPDSCQHTVHPPFSAAVHRTSLQLLVSFALRPGLPDSCQHTVSHFAAVFTPPTRTRQDCLVLVMVWTELATSQDCFQ